MSSVSVCSPFPAGVRVGVFFFFWMSVTLAPPRVISSVAAAAGWAARAFAPPSPRAGVSARPVAAVLVASAGAGAGAGAVFVVARSGPTVIAIAVPGRNVGWRARAPAIAVVVPGVYHGGWHLYVRLGVNELLFQLSQIKVRDYAYRWCT